jgi:hypothetical protein
LLQSVASCLCCLAVLCPFLSLCFEFPFCWSDLLFQQSSMSLVQSRRSRFPFASSTNCTTFPLLRNICICFPFPSLTDFQFELQNPFSQSIVTIISVFEFIFPIFEHCLLVYRFPTSVGSTVQCGFSLIATFFYTFPPMFGIWFTVDSDCECSEQFVCATMSSLTRIAVKQFFLRQCVLGRTFQWNRSFRKFHMHFFRVVEEGHQRLR